jgi:hypothetical protein
MAPRTALRVLACLAAVAALGGGVWGFLASRGLGQGTVLASGEPHATNDPPTAIFLTNPGADSNGVIAGSTPFTVTFNMCKTTDPDLGDELKFLYDYLGTGQFERGRCRGDHTYDQPGHYTATVCVSDRQPDHQVCRTYELTVERGTQARGSLLFSTSLVYWPANGCPDYVSIPWSVAGSLGSGPTPQVWIPLADSGGGTRSIVPDLDNNGIPDPQFQPSGALAGGCSAAGPGAMVRSNNILEDTNGNGQPDAGDTHVGLTLLPGNQVLLTGSWTRGTLFTLTGGSPYTGLTRNNGRFVQTVEISGYDNGGASTFKFKETDGSGPTASGDMELVDTDGDGIFDTVQAFSR